MTMIRRTILAAIILAAACLYSEAKNDKDFNRFRAGMGFGVNFPFSTGGDSDSDDGYKDLFGVGGKVGFDFYIPLYKGLFLMPGIYGVYDRTGDYLDDYDEYETHRLDLETYKRYPVTVREGYKETRVNHVAGLRVPMTLGYTFNYDRKVSYSLGVSGYANYSVLSYNIKDVSEYKYVTPDKFGENRSSHEKTSVNVFKEYKVPFKDKLSYGAGFMAGMRIGGFYWNYSFYRLFTDGDKKHYVHGVSIGFYF